MLDRVRAKSEIRNIVEDHLNHHGISIMVDRDGLIRKLEVHFVLCLDATKNELPRNTS